MRDFSTGFQGFSCSSMMSREAKFVRVQGRSRTEWDAWLEVLTDRREQAANWSGWKIWHIASWNLMNFGHSLWYTHNYVMKFSAVYDHDSPIDQITLSKADMHVFVVSTACDPLILPQIHPCPSRRPSLSCP